MLAYAPFSMNLFFVDADPPYLCHPQITEVAAEIPAWLAAKDAESEENLNRSASSRL